MSKVRQVFYPSISGRIFSTDLKVDEETISIKITNGGYTAPNEDIANALKKHPLFNHSLGFIVKDADKLKGEKRPTVFTGEPAFVEERPIAEVEEAVEIIDADEEEEATEEENTSEEEPAPEEPVEETETVVAEETTDTNGDGVITVEDVTNINQAKDYLRENFSVDARTINTPNKILASAEANGVTFPNLSL
jgi:hypothetical protein